MISPFVAAKSRPPAGRQGKSLAFSMTKSGDFAEQRVGETSAEVAWNHKRAGEASATGACAHLQFVLQKAGAFLIRGASCAIQVFLPAVY
jgi:hypothetical protein